ncbi:hypothetical protein ACVW1C_005252 [Bradyrhizobium sp. USDA 4011]
MAIPNGRRGAARLPGENSSAAGSHENAAWTVDSCRQAGGATEMSPDERRISHGVIFSIFELKVHGFVPPGIWKIREQELAVVQGRFAKHPRFAAWLDRIGQAKA